MATRRATRRRLSFAAGAEAKRADPANLIRFGDKGRDGAERNAIGRDARRARRHGALHSCDSQGGVRSDPRSVALPRLGRSRRLHVITTPLGIARGPMSNPRKPLSLTTAVAAGTVACAGGGLMFAWPSGMAHSRIPHPIHRGVKR